MKSYLAKPSNWTDAIVEKKIMTTAYRSHRYLRLLQECKGSDELDKLLAPKYEALPPMLSFTAPWTEEAIDERWRLTRASTESRKSVADPVSIEERRDYRRNIENYIGTVKMPVGLAGPLRVNGLFAQGTYYVPMATHEAALVASYSRGMQLMSEAGGCSAMVVNEGVSRAPGFVFRNLVEVGKFTAWALESVHDFACVTETTSGHCRLSDMSAMVEGNHVYLNFEFITGDASGQNMVAIAAHAICDYINAQSPVKPYQYFVEANFSGDKKACAKSHLTVRGRKVVVESIIPSELVNKYLHTTPALMADYWRISSVGGVMSGSVGVQGHFANGLAALYIACGQDVACVSESATGITRLELTPEGHLYSSVTMPNIIVGTVGGGTKLPSHKTCLEIMGLAGEGHSRALAEICAAVCLAGELSIIGSLCANDFTRAHAVLARRARAPSAFIQPESVT